MNNTNNISPDFQIEGYESFIKLKKRWEKVLENVFNVVNSELIYFTLTIVDTNINLSDKLIEKRINSFVISNEESTEIFHINKINNDVTKYELSGISSYEYFSLITYELPDLRIELNKEVEYVLKVINYSPSDKIH